MAPDTVRALASLHATLVREGPRIGPRIWPGFRPDTIATLYVIPNRAKLFAQWRDTLPSGFFPLPGVAATGWTDTRVVAFPRGRRIAFLSVDSGAAPGSVLGLALHEQFHQLQRASAVEGRRFGAGENALLVATYPIFDVGNEAAFALEGRLLARALRARDVGAARRAARHFLAVRERRQAHLDSSIAEFERAAELNEGLAQYALVRGLRELARVDGTRFATAASAAAATEVALLDSLLVVGPRSVRRRFYATGSGVALLLDRFSDSTWKERLIRGDETLQQQLAAVIDYRGPDSIGDNWSPRLAAELTRLKAGAGSAVSALATRRRVQRDSVLGLPGLRLVVDPSRLPNRRLNWCGFDPQNTLQTAEGELLHLRMLRLCGADVEIVFDQAVVETRTDGATRTIIGDTTSLRLTAGGVQSTLPPEGTANEMSDLRIEGPTFTMTAARAVVARRGGELRITPLWLH